MSEAAIHGGVRPSELAALGLQPAQVLDFSVNVSPIGPPAGVCDAIARVDVSRYPDPDCSALVATLSKRLDVSPDRILVGNGSTELIHLVTRVFVRHGQRPVVLAPAFGEYAIATELAGGTVYPWQARPQRAFRWNLKNKPDVLRRVAPPLIFLGNPNNPTGIYLDRDEVRALSNALVSGPLLLDEAYAGFVEQPWNSLPLTERGRAMVVRSMTKDYALAGLRLGYLVAHPEVVAAARRLQPSWSVNSIAQSAGIAALDDDGYLRRMRAAVREGKAVLVEGLRGLNLTIHEGAANFVLVEVGNGAALRAALLPQEIVVRDCASFGLPEYIRVGVRSPSDCRKLIEALTRTLPHLPAASPDKATRSEPAP